MSDNQDAYWSATKKLTWFVLAIWFFFGFVIHLFATQLNEIVIGGFPLGFYMASQGSVLAFVILIFFYVSRQGKIDEEYGVAE